MTQPLYKIQNLKFDKGNRQVLSIGNFEIHRGIIYAITGPSGTGKTTLLDIMAKKQKIPAGMIMYEEHDITASEVKQKYKDEVFYLPQSSLGGRGGVKRHMLKHIKTASWSNETAENRLEKVIRQMNLSEKLPRKLNTLSPGEKRWIDLAICIASDARVLIIDELEQHLGYDELENVKRLLNRKCGYEGTTIILGTLSPLTIRKMTGVSVSIDRGRIAMIRSVREGARMRPSGDRGRSRDQGSDRSRGGGRGRKESSDKPGGTQRSEGRGGGGRNQRRSVSAGSSQPPRRDKDSQKTDTRQSRVKSDRPKSVESPKPAAKSGRSEPPKSVESPKAAAKSGRSERPSTKEHARPKRGRGSSSRTPRKPQRDIADKGTVRDGNTLPPTPPVEQEPKEVDGNQKIEPQSEVAAPPDVDGNRKRKTASKRSAKSPSKPARRVGRGRGTPRAVKKSSSESSSSSSSDSEVTD